MLVLPCGLNSFSPPLLSPSLPLSEVSKQHHNLSQHFLHRERSGSPSPFLVDRLLAALTILAAVGYAGPGLD